MRCKQCGLTATSLLVNGSVLEKTYSAEYYQNRYDYYFQNCVISKNVHKDNTNIRDFRRGLDLIAKFKRHGKLLDVGCALGVFLSLARERGWETYGVDISQYATTYARKELGLEAFSGQLQTVNFDDQLFDVITLWDVLEHFPDPSDQLKQVHRILKDDGIVFINTPNEDGLLRLLGKILFRASGGAISYPLRKLYHEFHLYYFTPKTFLQLLERNGFSLIHLEKRCIPILKARGRSWERLLVKMLSWPERLLNKEYELWTIAKKKV
jgi:2-polyprenyl-3-methyl-5-hydroxy-6-metoxy-1,4-benzoquinol methylase